MEKKVAVVGTQWGDEGKGKIVDMLSEKADVIARAQGGNNAGHTVVVGNDQTILHIIPSGILHKGKMCLVGNGVVVDPEVILNEIKHLKEKGVSVDEKNLLISQNCHVIMPYHKLIDIAREEKKGKEKIGTTCRGIGPCYSDKATRSGIRMRDLINRDILEKRILANVAEKNILLKHYFKKELIDPERTLKEALAFGESLKKHITDVATRINKAMREGKNVLFEGAQGAMLDLDMGTYPYVTSSNTTAGGICTGLGVGPRDIDEVVGIVKAYTTRVGEGPFVTELTDSTGAAIREKGNEYGATTGRPRRCGWFDAVVLKLSLIHISEPTRPY